MKRTFSIILIALFLVPFLVYGESVTVNGVQTNNGVTTYITGIKTNSGVILLESNGQPQYWTTTDAGEANSLGVLTSYNKSEDGKLTSRTVTGVKTDGRSFEGTTTYNSYKETGTLINYYRDNVKVGYETVKAEYDSSGKLSSKIYTNYDTRDVVTGKIGQTFDSSGEVSSITRTGNMTDTGAKYESKTSFDNGKRTSITQTVYSLTEPEKVDWVVTQNYIGDLVKDKTSETYYPNGRIKQSVIEKFNNGVLTESREIKYNENGGIVSDQTYKGDGRGGFAPNPDTGYITLSPITAPGGTPMDSVRTTDFAGYLQTMYRIGIGLCFVLGVIMFTWAGIEYIISEAMDTKTDAKKRINAALIGLAIALASYIILQTINPDLLQLKSLNLSPSATTR